MLKKLSNVSVIIPILYLSNVFRFQDLYISWLEKLPFYSTKLSKFEICFQILFLCSLIYVFLQFSQLMGMFLLETNNSNKSLSLVNKFLKNNIQNLIQHCFVFLPAFTYCMLYKSETTEEKIEYYNLGLVWLFCRLFFIVSYAIETKTKILFLRSSAIVHSLIILVTLLYSGCLLYTSPSPRDLSTSRMPSSA